MHRFEFSELGRVFIPIQIKPQNKFIKKAIDFKLDTGADSSTISKLDLIDLGYDMSWIKQNVIAFKKDERPSTASDEKVDAGYVQLPLINILGYEGKNWPFQIILDEDKDFRNLLGRDLLTGFNYQINNDDDVLTINKAKTFKHRYTFLPGQEIHEIITE